MQEKNVEKLLTKIEKCGMIGEREYMKGGVSFGTKRIYGEFEVY
ncbi:hypothetical protein FACS189499_03300 [Clostridia bacterium]|nr:hypothetical protein FACS189499_03300 [Clostridia bacterium]